MKMLLPSGHEAFLDWDCPSGITYRNWHIHQRTDGKLIAVREERLVDGSRHKIYLQREVMPPPDGLDVDFIDGDGLNCRKNNLILRTKEEMKARPDQYRKWSPVPAAEYNVTRDNTPRNGANSGKVSTNLDLFLEGDPGDEQAGRITTHDTAKMVVAKYGNRAATGAPWEPVYQDAEETDNRDEYACANKVSAPAALDFRGTWKMESGAIAEVLDIQANGGWYGVLRVENFDYGHSWDANGISLYASPRCNLKERVREGARVK